MATIPREGLRMNILQKKKGEFTFLTNDMEVKTFDNLDDIPDASEIKEIIAFLPEAPPPPHTVQQHEEIHQWMNKFQELLKEIYASSS